MTRLDKKEILRGEDLKTYSAGAERTVRYLPNLKTP